MNLSLKRRIVHTHAREVATLYYYKRGYIPDILFEIARATASDEALRKYSPDQPRVPAENGRESGRWTNGSFNVDGAVDRLNKRTAGKRSTGECAKYVRDALNQGGGLNVKPPEDSIDAKDYGSSLQDAGFDPVATGDQQPNSPAIYPPSGYEPERGDVAIIQPASGHPSGHMEMYSGQTWISDFRQRDFWPGQIYRNDGPSFTIYRHHRRT